jgi:hypothetical protein
MIIKETGGCYAMKNTIDSNHYNGCYNPGEEEWFWLHNILFSS